MTNSRTAKDHDRLEMLIGGHSVSFRRAEEEIASISGQVGNSRAESDQRVFARPCAPNSPRAVAVSVRSAAAEIASRRGKSQNFSVAIDQAGFAIFRAFALAPSLMVLIAQAASASIT